MRRIGTAMVAGLVSLAMAGCSGVASSSGSGSTGGPGAATSLPAGSESPPLSGKGSFKAFAFTKVPEAYYKKASRQGRLEEVEYRTDDPENEGSTVTKRAVVYLPHGYGANPSQRYNVFYLMHGAAGSERTWMGTQSKPTEFKHMVDHMIQDGRIEPTIVVMPKIDRGKDRFTSTFPAFHTELEKAIMPLVEGKYRTYAENTTPQGFAASRSHRAFGGFSLGGGATWSVFQHDLASFEFFLPMSGEFWDGRRARRPSAEERAQTLAKIAKDSGLSQRDYFIFAATGTKDDLYAGLTSQIQQMRRQISAFSYTEKSFAEGNLTYYVVDGNRHSVSNTYVYLYNGLQNFFAQ